jgi:aspartate-semialdehyde dehydrogenase
MPSGTSVAVVGATGAVGSVLRGVLRERGYDEVRYFASSRSAGTTLDGRRVDEATPESLADAGVDVAFFAVGATASRRLVPHAVRGGALAVDKSSAWRMEPDVPLVVPEVNGSAAATHRGIVAVPNCSTIQLVCALKPLHDAAGLRAVRVATYQSVSGAGAAAMEQLRRETAEDHDLQQEWEREGEEAEEEVKIREETRKILGVSSLPIQATCIRVPVLVGHLEAVWVETERELTPEHARELFAEAEGVRVVEFPSPGRAAGGDDVLVGRVRRDPAVAHGITFLVAGDNLRKGAAVNAVQIAELLLARERVPV